MIIDNESRQGCRIEQYNEPACAGNYSPPKALVAFAGESLPEELAGKKRLIA